MKPGVQTPVPQKREEHLKQFTIKTKARRNIFLKAFQMCKPKKEEILYSEKKGNVKCCQWKALADGTLKRHS
jgi:hypothetical protein